jgi:two-component system phosphate regulon sensor histidine kinase PhoR/two-component system sensor histidine kinase VicK
VALTRLDEFYPQQARRALTWLAINQFLVLALTCGAFYLFHTILNLTFSIFVAATVFVATQLLFGQYYISKILEPLKMLSNAFVHISGDISTAEAPLATRTQHEASGLKAMVQTLYDLHSSAAQTPTPADQRAAVECDVIKHLPVGIIGLDAARRIIFHNERAPITADHDGVARPELMFASDNDSLDSWLDQVEKNSVSDEHGWRRIQNLPPGQDGRRIYDVVATYRKDAPDGLETIIVTVDQTAAYSDDEDGLNFMALAAHELRGPITVIRGYVDMMNEEFASKLTPTEKQLIDRVAVASNRLAGYINNILNTNNYDREHLKLTLAETTVAQIIDSVQDDIELRADTLGRHIAYDIPHDLPTVAASLTVIGEVVTNLVDNAIKYSSDGETVTIRAARAGDFVAISIIDHGIGMPPVVLEHLFDEFYRSHRSRDAASGTGIGLYISRGIVRSHGGEIKVSSVEGQGSTFTFTLPIYATVANKLKINDNSNEGVVTLQSGWIRNHTMYKS